MYKKSIVTLVFMFVINMSFASCIPAVNKKKPDGFPGGQFTPCIVSAKGDYCDPQVGTTNYMTRHHVFDKQQWIDILDKGLNHASEGSKEAQNNIIAILKVEGTTEFVLSDFVRDNQYCSPNTNKWLTKTVELI